MRKQEQSDALSQGESAGNDAEMARSAAIPHHVAMTQHDSRSRNELSCGDDDEHCLLPAKRRRYLEALAAQSPDEMIAVDQHLRIVDANPAALAFLQTPRQQIVGARCREVLRCKNLNRIELCGTSSCPAQRVFQEQRPLAHQELLFGAQDPSLAEVSASVTPVDIGEGPVAIFTARDVSALKVANSVRANFVSMVSHELRTPLNSVHGFIDLLLLGHMGALTQEQKLYLGYAQEGVQQLVSIVEDILLLTRSDLGQFEIKPQKVQANELVSQIIGSLQPQALKAEVQLRHDISPSLRLRADPQRIKQVLNNLVINAIKYTPSGGSVTIKARRYDREFAMLSVIDTGYGIPPEDRPHVFERFYQLHHREQSKLGGYGLGLSIARLIVEQHGGLIDFETEVDKGTTFYFTVPLGSS